MSSGPSKTAETLVGVLIPPACRQEVLGDLHERFTSALQYTADAARTVPLVIVSRMRRTADPQMLLIHAFALYLSFLGAAWLSNGAVSCRPWVLVRLAIPAVVGILGLVFDDTYANPGPRSALDLARGPLLSILLALAFHEILRMGTPDLAIARSVMFCGCALSLLLSTAVRMLFSPVPNQLNRINACAPAQEDTAPFADGSVTGTEELLSSVGAVRATLWLKHTQNAGKDGLMSLKTRIAVACTVLICAAGVLWISANGPRPGTTHTYSQFVDQVHSGQVASVAIDGGNSGAVQAIYRLKDGRTLRTVLPADYRDALLAMQDERVDVEIRNSTSAMLPLLIKAAPFLLLLGIWIYLMIRQFPNGPRLSALR